MTNEAGHRRWNNAAEVAGWAKREPFTNRVVPFVIEAANPQPGDRVLDIGPGGGNLTFAFAERIGAQGHATGLDISTGMTAWATERARSSSVGNVTFLTGDAQVMACPGAPFDLVVSQFGVMFFDDRLAAFRNLRRQLRPGGRLAFACWQEGARNTWHPGRILARFAPPAPELAPGVSPTGPFALGDAADTSEMLAAAGFERIVCARHTLIETVDEEAVRDRDFVLSMRLPPDREAEAEAAIEAHFARFRQPNGLSRFELNFQVFTAHNPG